MNLVNFLNKLIKKNGFILIDADNRKYSIGIPKKDNPITLKLLDKKLHHKLLLHPDLHFGEAYTDGSIIIENGTLTEFLEIVLENVGRGEVNIFSQSFNKLRGIYRTLTNFNLAGKSKKNVAHHYDISEKLYDLFLEILKKSINLSSPILVFSLSSILSGFLSNCIVSSSLWTSDSFGNPFSKITSNVLSFLVSPIIISKIL